MSNRYSSPSRVRSWSESAVESPRRAKDVAYLSLSHVPDELWELLRPAQRELHALWVKKFVLLYDDESRVRSEHLSDAERRLIRQILLSMANRRLTFRGPFRYADASAEATFLFAETDIDGEHVAIRALVRSSLDEADATEQVAIQASGTEAEVLVTLEWHANADPMRGAVMLYPQATRSKHRFRIAAYNRRQFAAMGRAFVEYLSPVKDTARTRLQ